MNIDQVLDFITEAAKLKRVLRKTLTYHEERYENSAEHSWHLVLATLAFKDFANGPVDLLKCMKMAVLHDLVEIDAGDIMIYHASANKFEEELVAAKKIFSLLPKEQEEEFLNLWIEFEKKETMEAKYVGSIDRFLPLLSNILNDGHSWKKHDISSSRVYQINQPAIAAGSKDLWNKTEDLIKKAIEDGHLRHDNNE